LFLVTASRMRAWNPAFEHLFIICKSPIAPWRKPSPRKRYHFSARPCTLYWATSVGDEDVLLLTELTHYDFAFREVTPHSGPLESGDDPAVDRLHDFVFARRRMHWARRHAGALGPPPKVRHTAPIDGKEYAAHRGTKALPAVSDVKELCGMMRAW
jgi:hypothetical protein